MPGSWVLWPQWFVYVCSVRSVRVETICWVQGITSTLPYWAFACHLHLLKLTRSPVTWRTTCWCGLVVVAKTTWGSPNTWRASPTRCILAIVTRRTVISMESFQMVSRARWWKHLWDLQIWGCGSGATRVVLIPFKNCKSGVWQLGF